MLNYAVLPEPTILAQASQARLGEIYREDFRFETLSPKREREECSIVGLTRSSGERFDFWAKSDLVQASVTRLSENSRLVLCVVLAQAR